MEKRTSKKNLTYNPGPSRADSNLDHRGERLETYKSLTMRKYFFYKVLSAYESQYLSNVIGKH